MKMNEITQEKTLREHLFVLVGQWDKTAIRVKQDGKWQSLFLSEVEDGQQILDWIKATEGRFWT